MPEPTYPVTIDTLGKLIDHGMGAFLWCPTCSKAGRLDVRNIDLKQLAKHVGRDWYFISRRWPIRCPALSTNARGGSTAGQPQAPHANRTPMPQRSPTAQCRTAYQPNVMAPAPTSMI